MLLTDLLSQPRPLAMPTEIDAGMGLMRARPLCDLGSPVMVFKFSPFLSLICSICWVTLPL